jgi:hypothetical protein
MLGVVCTAAGYILYFRLIADIGPLRSLSVTFLIPPFAALWGYLCLGETWRRIDSRRAAGLCGAVDDCRAVGEKTRGTGGA